MGQYSELRWPFPLAAYQDQRGVGSYIQGFLDAVAAEKKILCLGKCTYIQHANIIHLASLKEMLDKPLLKKDCGNLCKITMSSRDLHEKRLWF